MNCGFRLVVSQPFRAKSWFSSEIFMRLSTPQLPLFTFSATVPARCGGCSAGTCRVHTGTHKQQAINRFGHLKDRNRMGGKIQPVITVNTLLEIQFPRIDQALRNFGQRLLGNSLGFGQLLGA
jgi:hypothetical protein